MSIFYIIFLMLWIQSIVHLLPLHFFLNPRYSDRVCILLWSIPALEMPVLRLCFLDETVRSIQWILIIGTWLVIAIVGYSDLWWKRILAVAMGLLNALLGEVIVMGFFSFIFPQYLTEFNAMNLQRVTIYAAGTIVYLMIDSVELYLFRHNHLGGRMKGILFLCLIPIIQWIMQCSLENTMWERGGFGGSTWLLLCAQLCFAFVDIYWVMGLISLNRAACEESELEKIRLEMEQKKMHYQRLEEQREAMARIRHDYRNQMDSIYYLMKHDAEAAIVLTEQVLRKLRAENEDQKVKMVDQSEKIANRRAETANWSVETVERGGEVE